MKKKGGLILSLGVSIAAIIWVMQKVNIQSVAEAMKQTHVIYWVSAILIYLIGFFPRGLRWQLMLSKIKSVSFSDSTQIVILGYAANNLLPFRLGELVRAYVMGIKNNISKITCLGSIGAERVMDGKNIGTIWHIGSRKAYSFIPVSSLTKCVVQNSFFEYCSVVD
jgi:uncharacterized protein (TIRG00374 family)